MREATSGLYRGFREAYDDIRSHIDARKKRYRFDTVNGGSAYVTFGDTVRFTRSALSGNGQSGVSERELVGFVEDVQRGLRGSALAIDVDSETILFKVLRHAFPLLPRFGKKYELRPDTVHTLTIEVYNSNVAINTIAD